MEKNVIKLYHTGSLELKNPEWKKLYIEAAKDEGRHAAILCLLHKNKAFSDYKWHWFLINGYDIRDDKTLIKAVTYSEYEWLDFEELWNSGYPQKGGMVFVSPI